MKTSNKGIVGGYLKRMVVVGAFMLSFYSSGQSNNLMNHDFNNINDRIWIGRDYWAVPMEDWKVENGRIECFNDRGNSRINILTETLKGEGDLEISVKIGLLKRTDKGSAGFVLGLQNDTDNDVRSLAYFGTGTSVGIGINNFIFIGEEKKMLPDGFDFETVQLVVKAKRSTNENWTELTATDKNGLKATLSSNENFNLKGINTLANNHTDKVKGGNRSRFWFDDLKISGSMVEYKSENSFGPLLWTMYTLSKQEMKLMVQLPPISEMDEQRVQFQLKENGIWKTVTEAQLDPNARIATFKMSDWNDSKDHEYRVLYVEKFKDNSTKSNYYSGTIRKDPKGKELEMAAMTCQYHYGFPYRPLTDQIVNKNPDILFFSGDQIYEPNGGYGIIRFPAERAILSYLGKWYMFGWAFGDLMKNRPTLCLADDHEVFQGNLWGNGGKKVTGQDWNKSRDATSGFVEPVEMVNVVIRTNTSHQPEPYDPTPIDQGMEVYYTDVLYGNVSFALVTDRTFKSGPEQVKETTKGLYWNGRKDMLYEKYPKSSEEVEQSLKLMGERQLDFVDHWIRDWEGANMKVFLSQTIFANNVTHYGRSKVVLKSDLDSGGWPKYGRDKIVDLIRKGFAFHICGDQHLPSQVQYGLGDFKDGSWVFCTPAVAVGYPRRFMPDTLGIAYTGRPKHNFANTGLYEDGFGNKNYVYAVGNPDDIEKHENRYQMAQNKASGFGYITFDTNERTIKTNSYRFLEKNDDEKGRGEFEGWPVTVNQLDNFKDGRNVKLPCLSVNGMKNAIVEIVNEQTNQLEHIVRIDGKTYEPVVSQIGTYTIHVYANESGEKKTFKNIASAKDNKKKLKVNF